MLKTPQNLTVPLRTYRKRLIKELVHFSWSITKTSYISMEHRKYGTFGATEGGDVTLLHIGFRDYHGVKTGLSGGRGRGNTMEQDVLMLAYRSQMLNVFGGLDLSVDLHGMHGIVSLAHKWAKLIVNLVVTRECWFQILG